MASSFEKGNEIGKTTRFEEGNEIGKDSRFEKGRRAQVGIRLTSMGESVAKKTVPTLNCHWNRWGWALPNTAQKACKEGKTKTLRSTDRVYFECTKQILVRYKPY